MLRRRLFVVGFDSSRTKEFVGFSLSDLVFPTTEKKNQSCSASYKTRFLSSAETSNQDRSKLNIWTASKFGNVELEKKKIPWVLFIRPVYIRHICTEQ